MSNAIAAVNARFDSLFVTNAATIGGALTNQSRLHVERDNFTEEADDALLILQAYWPMIAGRFGITNTGKFNISAEDGRNGIHGGLQPAFKLLTVGTGYVDDFYGVTGGTGTGAEFDIQTSGGSVTYTGLWAAGVNYTPGDIITLVGGNNDATIMIVGVTNTGAIKDSIFEIGRAHV